MSLEKNTPRQNRLREALEKIYDQHPPHFAEYLRRFREDPKSRVFAPLAEAYRRMGRVEEAIQICREGLEHHPDFYGGRVALAKCLMDKKRFEEAKAELEKVIQAAPENLMAQRLLGDTFLMLHQRKEALHSFKMALLLAPQDVSLSEKVYAIEKSLGAMSEEAFAQQTPPKPTVEEIEDVEISVVTEIPAGMHKAMEKGEPVHVFAGEQVVAEDETPADPDTESRINQILGFTEEDANDESYHVEPVTNIFEENPKSQQEITTETLGDLYFSQGQFDKALRIFEKILRTRPTSSVYAKVEATRGKLGVDRASIARGKKITVLQGILDRLHQSP